MPARFNQTLGVQRDGALTEFIVMPPEKLYAAKLTTKELCLVEPLTVGFHAVSRGRVAAQDTVLIMGCGGVGLGASCCLKLSGRHAPSALTWKTKNWNLHKPRAALTQSTRGGNRCTIDCWN